jgi:hypothetical protein
MLNIITYFLTLETFGITHYLEVGEDTGESAHTLELVVHSHVHIHPVDRRAPSGQHLL